MVMTALGAQFPRITSVPEFADKYWDDALAVLATAGVKLDPWQLHVLRKSLGVREDGLFAAKSVGLVVPRQNGKGEVLLARALVGLYVLREGLIIHSAHQFDTSLEAFRRLLMVVEDCPKLMGEVKRVSRSHGEEGLELDGGPRIRFRTRTKGGGRGFSCDCLILDEAMVLPEATLGALLPTQSARPNPQTWYAGSAVDQLVHEHGVVLARVRDRGERGDDPRLAYFEWSADGDLAEIELVEKSERAWADANPGLGIRIDPEHVEYERRSMDPRTFGVERLGIGDWPPLDGNTGDKLTAEQWLACVDRQSRRVGPVCFAFDVTPDRSKAAIGVAGRRADGLAHVEIVEHRPGTSWVPDRLVELLAKYETPSVVCDTAGPAASLLAELANAGVEVHALSAREHAQACGAFFDACTQQTMRHLGTPELTAAVKGAARRPLNDAWAWSRKNSTVDISPLVAVTLALWGSDTVEQPVDLAANIW